MFSAKIFKFSKLARLMTMLLLGVIVPSISANHLKSTCFLVNRGTAEVNTIQDDTDGNGNVYNAEINGCPYQSWWLHGDGDTFDITNMGTGRVLESNHKGEVFTSLYNGRSSQKWRWNGNMMYCLQNVATGLFLTIEWEVSTQLYTGAANQQWERRHETAF